jgi:hypothetical protein
VFPLALECLGETPLGRDWSVRLFVAPVVVVVFEIDVIFAIEVIFWGNCRRDVRGAATVVVMRRELRRASESFIITYMSTELNDILK